MGNPHAFSNWVNYGVYEILQTYGEVVHPKGKSVLKFGKNLTLGTSWEQINLVGDVSLETTNSITHVSSSSADDTGIVVKIEGHTLDANGDRTFVTQSVTLTGQTKAALTTPLADATRVFVGNLASLFGTTLAGTVYVFEDDTSTDGVPQTATKIHAQTGESNQSLKATTWLSKTDWLLCTQAYLGVDEKTTATVDGELRRLEKGGVWRSAVPLVASSAGGNAAPTFTPPVIFKPNSGIGMWGKASTTNVSVDAWFNGVLLAPANTYTPR